MDCWMFGQEKAEVPRSDHFPNDVQKLKRYDNRNQKNRGYSCDRFTDPPGREWNGFVHRADELVTVADGILQMTVADVTVIVHPGDEVFIPAGAVHSVKNIHDGTSNWLYGYNTTY